MTRIRFGPAGIPLQGKAKGTVEGIKSCAELGLNAMEMEFVQGVRMKEELAAEVRQVAAGLDISLSSHAPYYVNLCTSDKAKLENTKRHILSSARMTSLAGGIITVFHPGFYQKLTPAQAYSEASRNLKEIVGEIKSRNIKIRLGAETVGKKGAFGGLDENIRLSQEIEMVEPAIDFAHLHARGDHRIMGEAEYITLFDKLERELPGFTKKMHCHFSEINYNERGERNHYVLGTNNEPPFKPLMKVLAEGGYGGTVICETPNLDMDAQKMMEEYGLWCK